MAGTTRKANNRTRVMPMRSWRIGEDLLVGGIRVLELPGVAVKHVQ